jgi:hypothetical protein
MPNSSPIIYRGTDALHACCFWNPIIHGISRAIEILTLVWPKANQQGKFRERLPD